MAKYELPIYGENDAVVKEYKTNVCPWAVYIEAVEIAEKQKENSPREQLEAIGAILKSVFVGLTDDELRHADTGDVVNTFTQITRGGQTIKSGASKNA
jgi:hypothetical protein